MCFKINMIDIKQKFIELTSRTYPHGTEQELFHLLPDYFLTDEFGNKYTQVGETSTMFTCHLDTVPSGTDREPKPIKHIIDGDIIKTDGETILGADDKAGVCILLYMIENKIPGLYYFFLGEEVGCIGSKKLAEKFKTDKLDYINKVVSFDRRDLHSVITFQSYSRSCSEKFGDALSLALTEAGKEVLDNDIEFTYKTDPTGVCTDSIQFTSIYPECTNISVGYYEEHTHGERQNIRHLDKLAKACCFVKWEELPVDRDPTTKEYLYERDYDNWDRNYVSSRIPYRHEVKEETKYFFDRAFGKIYSSSVKLEKVVGGKEANLLAVDFSPARKEYETNLIIEFFFHLDVIYKTLTWTGEKVIVCYEGSHNFTEMSRTDLAEFLHELDFWKDEVEIQRRDDFFDYPEWMYYC